jgi:O-antigen chain-terminating methyltransferase
MSDNFYRAFEDRHRGSRELIKTRLGVYLPFVQPLLGGGGEAKAVDLGCGRGEWLELITGLGFDAVGVDLDKGMLEACHELGLKVEKGDALSFLAVLPDESQSIVSAFHVVEHVTFEQLQTLVSQALRVLKPGGLLIMETPNPENIVVATRNFYLDPTHQRPIPPELLSFLPEYYGFARSKILRLQESKELAQRTELALQDVLGGASPDYAVVAQTAAAVNVVSLLDTPFSLEYGLSLESLTARYQDQLSARFQQAETKAQQAQAQAQQAQAQAQQAAQRSEQLATELGAVYASQSWRITRPLRWLARRIRTLRKDA